MSFKVLIADDDPYILMSLEFLMKKNKYEVLIARNGSEAHQLALQHRPDLAVLDIMMPEMDGYELCKQIKNNAATHHCQVIFLSAKSKQEDIEKGYQTGAALYIPKPFSTKYLIQQIEILLTTANTKKTLMDYQQQWQHSIQNPNDFWLQQAALLNWFKKPDTALSYNTDGKYAWYEGGKLNLAYLCLDYHLEQGRGEQTALIYDSPVTQSVQKFTYNELRDAVSKLAGVLQAKGVDKGDRVIIYMPMIPEAVMAMLACARIGAIHSVVFGGFAPHELAVRIEDATPKMLITANYGIETDKKIHYKPLVDAALAQATHQPDSVIVLLRNNEAVAMQAGRDFVWSDLMQEAVGVPYIAMDATDPLYILYTSGTTGKPKGILRDHSYAVALKYSMGAIYDTQAGDVFWAASDVGWVVGHSYIVYGPLLQGCTTILYEGKPIKTPDAAAFWRVIEQHRVKVLFTAPTAIRAIKKEDFACEGLKRYDISSLKYLFLAGERCDPDTYNWIKSKLQRPIIDHWWQTESGWPMLGIMMGLEAKTTKEGSANLPICGYDIQVLNENGAPLEANEEGFIAVKMPLPPGCLRTLWNNEAAFQQAYLSKFQGYYLTGDGGYYDEDGYFFVMGRIDDNINVAGHRLSTGEMEQVIAAHPAVAECAVLGIADSYRGQIPVGLVVIKDSIMQNEAEISEETIALVRDQIGAIACYRTTLIVQRLPKTRSGKILRKTLRFIADGVPYTVPSTIDDPLILTEITEILRSKKIGIAFSEEK